MGKLYLTDFAGPKAYLRWIAILIATLLAFALIGQDLSSLHYAALQGDKDAIEAHIAKGSDLNEKDAYGSYPILIAATFGHNGIARSLIDAGADLSVADAYGSTALHLAALFGRTKIASALLNAGADKYALTQNGATPYDIAAGAFDRDSGLYQNLIQQLGPLGLQLDMEALPASRDSIAGLLRPGEQELNAVDLALPNNIPWPAMEPIEAGLSEELIAELFYDAAYRSNILGIIILKNDHVVAEKYFNGHSAEQLSVIQSVTKSYFASLVGIAMETGCISSLDQKMVEFFPEFADELKDSPKAAITIKHLLQMRAGYPWEELNHDMWQRFMNGVDQFDMIADVDLVNDPGKEFNYSNLSNYILGIIASRACGRDLKELAAEYLLKPIHSGPGEWYADPHGNYYSLLSFTTRDMAALGQLYLNDGHHEGKRVLPNGWCSASLDEYSSDAWVVDKQQQHAGRYHFDLNYGYQWWSADIAGHRVPFAWGHGGQMIYILEKQDLVVVVMSDPQWRKHDSDAWKAEQSSFNLAGKFLSLLLSS